MKHIVSKSPSPPHVAQEPVAALEAVLTELTLVHEELLDLVREHRRGISGNDSAAIQECLSRQGILGVRANQLERRRHAIVQSLSGKARATIADVAATLPADDGQRITMLAARLREVLSEIQRENSVVRAATQSLASHIDGLMQQVARALSRAGTYGRQGKVEGGPVACGLDMVH